LPKGQTWLTILIIALFAVPSIAVILASSGVTIDQIISFFFNTLISIAVIALGTFLILFGVIFAGHNPRTGRILAYIGVGVFVIGLFILEMAYVVKMKESQTGPTAWQPNIKCGSASGDCTGLFCNVDNMYDFITCLVTGYKYKGGYGAWSFVGFWIFGVVTPLLLLIFLFIDFVESSRVIQNLKSQKIIGICLGLIAYRGFIVSNLMEILSLGTTGIAMLAIDLIFAGGILAYVNRVFAQWEPIEEAMGIVRSSLSMRNRLAALAKQTIDLIQADDTTTANTFLTQMKNIANSMGREYFINRVASAQNYINSNDKNKAISELRDLIREIRRK